MLEGILAGVAPLRKVVVVAVRAVEAIVLGNKLLTGQRVLTAPAEEAGLVPVASLVGQILRNAIDT